MPRGHDITQMTDRKPPRSIRSQDLQFNIETERETDGRWIAEVREIPGALAYGKTEKQAKAKAYAVALRASPLANTSNTAPPQSP
jgi:hypothetical protein